MKDIKNYEGLYAVTEDGRVWSYKKNKFLSPSSANGYLQVVLSKKGKHKTYRIHRLVAEAYLENPNNLPEVNHKDENKGNNTVENLEWCTRDYNVNFGSHPKKRKPIYCVELDKIFIGARQAASELHISRANICSVVLGDRATAGGYHWRYV